MVFYFGCPKLTSAVIKNGITISTNPDLYHSVPAPPQSAVLAIQTFITFNFLDHTLSSLHNLFSCWHYIWNMVCVTDLFSSFRYHISIMFIGLALVVYSCNPHTQETQTKRLSLIPSWATFWNYLQTRTTKTIQMISFFITPSLIHSWPLLAVSLSLPSTFLYFHIKHFYSFSFFIYDYRRETDPASQSV